MTETAGKRQARIARTYALALAPSMLLLMAGAFIGQSDESMGHLVVGIGLATVAVIIVHSPRYPRAVQDTHWSTREKKEQQP